MMYGSAHDEVGVGDVNVHREGDQTARQAADQEEADEGEDVGSSALRTISSP